MSEWFHLGEVCLLVGSPEDCVTQDSAKYLNTEVTIAGFGSAFADLPIHEYQFVTWDGERGSCTRKHLRKKPPEGNDQFGDATPNERTNWNDSPVWQPSRQPA
jgi:hypothetical protein